MIWVLIGALVLMAVVVLVGTRGYRENPIDTGKCKWKPKIVRWPK